jgi:hypothetical protein
MRKLIPLPYLRSRHEEVYRCLILNPIYVSIATCKGNWENDMG